MILRLATRQGWISYRLLGLILAPVLVAAVAGGAESGGVLARGLAWQFLAVGLGVSTLLTAVVEAAGLAGDRERGMLGWLAVRAVPRPTILTAWFVVPLAASVAGTASALAVARMTLEPALIGSLDDAAYLATTAAVLAAGVAAASLGLVMGVLMSRFQAGLMTVFALMLTSAAVVAASVLLGPGTGVPGAGFWLLAQATVVSDPLPTALLSTGLSLGVAAALWVVSAAAFSRRSL